MKKLSRDNSISENVDGLGIRNGREVNRRPDGVSGIAQAAMYKQEMKKQYKIDCIADGIERAKMRMDGRYVFGY